MESVIAGVPDRGGNDHYAVRGQLAWQPSETTDLNLIVRYMKADKETQAGIYSQEPACPNDQFQGEFTRRRPVVRASGARGRARAAPAIATTRSRRAAVATRGRPPKRSAPTSTARSRAPRCMPTSTSASCTWSRSPITRTPSKFYLEGGDASPVDGVLFYQGSDLEQYSQEFRLSGQTGSHTWVAGLYGMQVDGDYTGKFATPFYGYDPTIEMIAEDDVVRGVRAGRMAVRRRLEADRRRALLERRARRHVLRLRARSAGAVGAGHDHLQPERGLSGRQQHQAGRREATASTASPRACSSTGSRPTTCCSMAVSTAAARAAATRSRPARRTIRTAARRFRAAFLEGMPFDEETLDAYELGAKSTLGDSTTPERRRVLLRLLRLPGVRAVRPGADRHQPRRRDARASRPSSRRARSTA